MDQIEKAMASSQEITVIDKSGKFHKGKLFDHYVRLSADKLRGKIRLRLSQDQSEIEVEATDILSIDIGMRWPAKDGFFTDTAITIPLGPIKKEVELLLERTQKALEIGMAEVRPGKSVADVGRAIENYLKPFGYGIVRALVGHGVGYKVHEPPQVPNYYQPALEKIKIEPGMVLALEPMVTLGTHEVKTLDDGWTIVPADDSLCAHFEHTVIATEGDPVVVTRRPDEK